VSKIVVKWSEDKMIDPR